METLIVTIIFAIAVALAIYYVVRIFMGRRSVCCCPASKDGTCSGKAQGICTEEQDLNKPCCEDYSSSENSFPS